jgi:hypothetical protein
MMSRRSIDILIDLVENRMACMQVVDREDHRQFAILSQARRELQGMKAVPALVAEARRPLRVAQDAAAA